MKALTGKVITVMDGPREEEILDGLPEALAKITSFSKNKKREWQSMENFNYELLDQIEKCLGYERKPAGMIKYQDKDPRLHHYLSTMYFQVLCQNLK